MIIGLSVIGLLIIGIVGINLYRKTRNIEITDYDNFD